MERYNILRRYSLFFLSSIIALLMLVQGCHSGGGAGPIAAPEGTYQVGYFLDSPVEGLEYRSISWSGITDSQGSFYYRASEEVTFYLGDVIIGRTSAQRIITPVDLGGVAANTASTKVINIAQFLQSLDEDQMPSNGIYIPQEVRDALEGIVVDFTQDDLNNDAGVQEMFDRLNGMDIYPEENIGLISAEEAQIHLENTITQIETEEAEAEEALNNLSLSASIGFPYSSVLMIQGQSINLQGYVYGGKTPYTYAWRINSEEPFSTRLSPGKYTFRTLGSYTITFTATDSTGDVKTDIRHINVFGSETQEGDFPADSIPSVGIVSPPSGSTTFSAGNIVTFQAFLNNGNTPLYYGWSVGAAPDNTYDPRSEIVTYISPRTFIVSQDIQLNAPGEYSIFILIQDTPVGSKGPDQHAASTWVVAE